MSEREKSNSSSQRFEEVYDLGINSPEVPIQKRIKRTKTPSFSKNEPQNMPPNSSIHEIALEIDEISEAINSFYLASTLNNPISQPISAPSQAIKHKNPAKPLPKPVRRNIKPEPKSDLNSVLHTTSEHLEISSINQATIKFPFSLKEKGLEERTFSFF